MRLFQSSRASMRREHRRGLNPRDVLEQVSILSRLNEARAPNVSRIFPRELVVSILSRLNEARALVIVGLAAEDDGFQSSRASMRREHRKRVFSHPRPIGFNPLAPQ